MIKYENALTVVLQNCISREYFIKVLNWIVIINSISGIIAIGVILFLYKLWKKSSQANEIIYLKLKELENGRAEAGKLSGVDKA